MAEEKYTIFDLGWNKNLVKEDPSSDEMKEAILDSLDPNLLRSGNWIGNLVMSKGYLRSSNYVAGSLGWNIEFDGTAQFSDITLIGGTINYGKTSFTDAANAGYYISADGIYFGSASDTSYLKYAIATGLLTVGGGTITGGIIQTASGTGQRVKIDSSDNTLTFYNASNNIITQLGGGTSIANALRINLDASTTTGVKITGATDNDIGFRFDYSGNSTTTGLYVGLTGATNDGNCLNLVHNGSSGNGIYLNITAGAKGLAIYNTGNANALYISHSHDSAICIDIAHSGRQEALYITGDDVNSSKPLIYATSAQADGTACANFNKTDYGPVLNITSTNSSNNNYTTGIKFNLSSSGTSVEIAFEFAGAEYIAGATAVSGVTGVIKIVTSDGLCYLPVYSAYS